MEYVAARPATRHLASRVGPRVCGDRGGALGVIEFGVGYASRTTVGVAVIGVARAEH
ncbi:hypothetical protein KKP04_05680 [Rhodomicrobium sp. Az07]|uniref:hypothetical protein n=1 Tax=Rhodomicrobium sp. Az07 TaxID=2839034 RepID=UPI001BE9A356|nr:hypothetical protein [Rhodomicrobium sp. Az07]MBT3070356.1 hypothetical protein [Rhodomicrobium sp. Az07]